MVSALLDAGHSTVFVFLLRWRPERFGTSADASARVLRGWLDAQLGAEASAARVVIKPIQHDDEGAGLMRAHLGAGSNPEVQVNYSRKYAPEKFKPRIENDWMPIYLTEFPLATPSFLPDEQDPGGEGAAGTGAFVTALAGLRDARSADAAGTAVAVAALEAFRPSPASPEEWSVYVDGLLGGANSEPFYTGDEKKAIEAAFFADAAVRKQLAVSPLAGGDCAYFDDTKNWKKFWQESLTQSKDEALWARFAADDGLWRSFASGASSSRGVVVDCGSGHTSIMFYAMGGKAGPGVRQVKRCWLKHNDGGNLALTDIMPSASGGAFKGTTLASRLDEFIQNLVGMLEQQQHAAGWSSSSNTSCVLHIGATGGVREKIAQGELGEEDVEIIRDGFERAFADRMSVVKFEVITGGQEATWEHAAAQIIWGANARKMFPAAAADETTPEVGLFSGGGKSMQLGRRGSALSFPFSTFPAELEERQGAAPDAWLDPVKWDRFADDLVAKVKKGAADHNELFTGCFVGTAMNHRAAKFTEIAETPITAAAAATALRASLSQFRAQEGELYERLMADSTPGSSYPLARIVSMHTFRLATVLEVMFAPDAQFYFAKNGVDGAGEQIDCEWTVGAFAQLTHDERQP
jgi:hypothetical protein